MEFYNTQFSFIDKESWEEHYVSSQKCEDENLFQKED